MEYSIFEQIQNAVTKEGRLPEDFRLPDEAPDNQIKFAPGAMDGIIFYHVYHVAAQSEASEGYPLLVNAINAAAAGRTDEAIHLVYEFASEHHILGFIDLFQQYVQENQDRLPVENVINFAIDLMLKGTKEEAVKFGMSLLELIDLEGQEQIKEAVRLLALSDEFTLYAAFLMRSWENPNKELFDILQKVEGWGRVHLVRMIEADSDVIEEWLVRNGVHNNVVPAYSGLDCFEKVHYLERIQNKALDLEDYRGLADILDAMLDEGPVVGVSALENAEEIIQAFFAATKIRTDLEAQDYVSLIDLRDYIQDKDGESAAALKEVLTLFLQSKQIKETIQSALEKGEAFEIARRLGMDYQEYAYRAVEEDFVKNAWIASLLIKDDYKVQEILDLAYDKLHVEKIATGAADEAGFGEGFETYQALTMILQVLCDRIHVGENLIQPALKSPVVSNRNVALSVLEAWMNASGKAIQEISPTLAKSLEDGLQDEVREDIRERMEQILNNCLAQTADKEL